MAGRISHADPAAQGEQRVEPIGIPMAGSPGSGGSGAASGAATPPLPPTPPVEGGGIRLFRI